MSVAAEFVYQGPWINWDGGHFSGSRITMTTTNANILSIFSGVFITFIEAGFWSLISYVTYQIQYSTTTTNDALHLQKQVLLRNSASDVSDSYSMFCLGMAWKSRKVWAIRRTAFISVIALANFLFFVLALPFLYSLLTKSAGDEVLVRSPNCGFWWPNSLISGFNFSGSEELLTSSSWQATNYADNCYGTDISASICDSNFVSRQISWKPNLSAECPFASGLCWGGDNHAITMETELVDSHATLGINAEPHDRLFLQRQTTCAPLNWTNRVGYVGVDEVFYFGKVGIPRYSYENYTYAIWLLANYTFTGYNLDFYQALIVNGSVGESSTFTPIPELQRADGDLTLVFLANNGVSITNKCEDPIFSATRNTDPLFPDLYYRDYPATVMGCLDRYRLLNPVTNFTTNYLSVMDVFPAFIDQQTGNLSARQLATFLVLRWALTGTANPGFAGILKAFGAQSLLAQRKVDASTLISGPLPSTQWTIEASHWFNISLALFQQTIVEVATGPAVQDAAGLTNTLPVVALSEENGTNLTKLICQAQKVKNLNFVNFNLFGFVAFVVIGAAIILSPIFVIPVIQKFALSNARRLAWTVDNNLQLFRLAHEAVGVGDRWKNTDKDIPIPTGENENGVGILDTENIYHPVLKRQSTRTRRSFTW